MLPRHRSAAAFVVLLTLLALGFRLYLALHFPNDEPDDARVYSQIARNILEQKIYSLDTEAPYEPTLIRVPGYPLFLAAVYAVFGHDNNRAARVAQAVVGTLTCWAVALLACVLAPADWSRQRRRRAMLIALALAALCPFTAIYVTTLLTEVCAAFFLTLLVLMVVLAMRGGDGKRTAGLWLAAGLVGGVATLFRPDSGIFTAAAGVTLCAAGLTGAVRVWKERSLSSSPLRVLSRTFMQGLLLSVGFATALAPWALRNARIFGLFQPIAPYDACMPDEFVPRGYEAWLRTWIDHSRYVESFNDALDVAPIRIEDAPASAFDSADERARVSALLDRYNGTDPKSAPPPGQDVATTAGVGASSGVGGPDGRAFTGEMTPAIDAEFGRIARDRSARHPVRTYFVLPLERMLTIWFDTHSQYYPFSGLLLPLSDLDRTQRQHIWLPLFILLTWAYTALAAAGCVVLGQHSGSRRWILLLLGLTLLPRMLLLSWLPNPEPRYVVEYFPLLLALSSLPLSRPGRDRFDSLT